MVLPLILAGIGLAKLAAPFIIGKVADKYAGKWAGQIKEIAATITGTNDPEKAAEILQADPTKLAEFQAQAAMAATHLEEAYLQDVQDARNRDIELAKLGRKNYRADAITAATYILLILCIVLSVFMNGLDEWMKTMINMTATFCLAKLSSVFDFEFGSSKGSRDKDEISLQRQRANDRSN